MSKESKKTGVASFDPRWVKVWGDAPLRTIRLDFPDHSSAITQRHALYRLREGMRFERHELSLEADKCKVSGPFPTEDNPVKDRHRGHYLLVRSKETTEGLAAL